MSTIGNLLWFVFGGFLIVLFYLFGGLILCITIIGIPFGIQSFKLAGFALAPFGNSVVTNGGSGCLSIILNIIWILFAGIELAIIHLILALVLAVTIVGIPFAMQHIKMAGFALVPFGRTVRGNNFKGK